jgi:hypothetical protein
MKVQSNIRAGMTYQECDSQRNAYKSMVQSGHCTGLLPPQPQPYPPYYPPYPPNPPYPGPEGGWVDGVWYADRSGVCG